MKTLNLKYRHTIKNELLVSGLRNIPKNMTIIDVSEQKRQFIIECQDEGERREILCVCVSVKESERVSVRCVHVRVCERGGEDVIIVPD
jgi:hypothetical protein